jgi:hypothetical protein
LGVEAVQCDIGEPGGSEELAEGVAGLAANDVAVEGGGLIGSCGGGLSELRVLLVDGFGGVFAIEGLKCFSPVVVGRAHSLE